MNVNRTELRNDQGFDIYTLSNGALEVAVVPQLGARIISLKNLRSGREWMWHPEGGLKLFRNSSFDDFSTSPLAGMDECLPTIAPCCWRERQLPDHGEVWSRGWTVDSYAWDLGIIKTAIALEISSFEFHRSLELHQNEITLTYRLLNRSSAEEPFLWAMHPLLRLQAGDQLDLPKSTRSMLPGADWIDSLDSSPLQGNCAKIFAYPVREGLARITNRKTNDSLEFKWNPEQNNTLGIWLTRGGWHGHHHFALEPTNGSPDALTQAADNRHCGRIPPSGETTWQIHLRLEN